ncbi:motility-associated protein [Marinomonas phaeophyticola]|uniref:motility-associated protein n=1 Tax=Marinomonas phaeophyticola TaxID=3004091 RepID=UPI002E81025C|nr:motility-associated protein [Marinomonas sp. 15G1-11]
MFAVLGMLVVIGSVIAGYLASHGNLLALWQPFEVLIICGAALGAFMTANPISLQKRVFKMLPQIILGSRHNKIFYLQLLSLTYSLFQKVDRMVSSLLKMILRIHLTVSCLSIFLMY